MDKIDHLIRDLCEIPDRNSPDDQPEMLLVTAAEIRTAIERWIPAMPTTKDAERYRKLRDEENWGDDGADGGGSRWAVLGELTGAGFDAFVDALPETPNVELTGAGTASALNDGLAVAPDEATVFEGRNMTDDKIEQEIQAKGLTAPRITPADLEANIASEWYINAGDGVVPDDFQPPVPANHPLRLLTFCVLVLKNGFTVTGESACASPENFDAELGKKIAKQNAVAKMWPLMGYALKERLAA